MSFYQQVNMNIFDVLAELAVVKSGNINKYHDSGNVISAEINCLPSLKEIHIVKLVQLYRKLQCSLYFRHDIIPLITCQQRRKTVNMTQKTNKQNPQWKDKTNGISKTSSRCYFLSAEVIWLIRSSVENRLYKTKTDVFWI